MSARFGGCKDPLFNNPEFVSESNEPQLANIILSLVTM